jgi:hypothetical protein
MTVSTVVSDLERLRQLYRAGFHDPFLDKALHKIIYHQITRDLSDLRRVNEVLTRFEAMYHLPSAEFWKQFQAGQMADTADFMEWNIYCQMRERLLARLTILGGQVSDEYDYSLPG